jgi:hypothetical protein
MTIKTQAYLQGYLHDKTAGWNDRNTRRYYETFPTTPQWGSIGGRRKPGRGPVYKNSAGVWSRDFGGMSDHNRDLIEKRQLYERKRLLRLRMRKRLKTWRDKES